MSSAYSFISLDPLLPAISSVNGLNNSGQLVGTFTDSGSVAHGYSWKNGILTPVDGISNPFYVNLLRGINDAGDVTGYAFVPSSGLPHAFVVRTDGTVITTQVLGDTYPVGIDNSGQIIGNGDDALHAVNIAFIANPPYVAISQLLADPQQVRAGATFVEGINATGTAVVGFYYGTTHEQAFIYDGTNYADVPAPAGSDSVAYGVNDRSQVVGQYSDQNGTHGFIYDGTTFLTVDNPLAIYGTRLWGIDDFGQIIGTYVDGSNQTHKFLTTPDQLTQAQVVGILTPMTGGATGQIIDYLHARGLLLNGATITTGSGNFAPVLPGAQFAILAGAQETITSGGTLKFVVNWIANSNLVVHGSADIGVSAAIGNNQISLQDSGNDTVFLAGGNNTVSAGAGDDTVYGGGGNDVLIAGSGANSQFCGGYGNDVFVGGASNSYVDGGAGDDTIYGGSGTDALHGGSGHDVIYAGDGSSYLFADAGNSTLYGGSGSDTMYAGSGDARLVALGSNYNELYGGPGNSVLIAAGSGNTLMVAGSGNNYLQGGGGDDTMYGGAGRDTLQAGSGHDHLISRSVAGPAGQGNLLQGGSGDSVLWAGAGSDTLFAGSGHDILISGTGSSQMTGSNNGNTIFEIVFHTGNDTVTASGTGNVAFIDGRASTDGIIVTSGAITTITFADTGQALSFTGVQQLYFTDGPYST
ncbi:hypothetical protein XH98_37315 [Bradyrhizobium sp. CCBAU 51745]|uniref:hypothetical protein n=1 Tax=Bradyrhizobium sp. CCBAU 51745 TaxID=1325099 RepID=UPI002305C410|nr:hypothetical protein [Bradyrhizobium sp. CCBAU 51745]MDA9444630.1 hypothetical protein [Bradyrhizobium sp. CCBAU 51745]